MFLVVLPSERLVEAFYLCQKVWCCNCDGIMFSDCLKMWKLSGLTFLKHLKNQTLKLIYNSSVLMKEYLFISAHHLSQFLTSVVNVGVKKLLQCYVHMNWPIFLIQRGKGSSDKFISALNRIKGILTLILRATTPSTRWSTNGGENRNSAKYFVYFISFQ